ncbi:MAG TPA: bifunctional folylpolyglutamate synthase/dihydrofolate synthase [Campylobacterales bacterium]|nr:bifunctional folylpolyglutamate synthase/dihydrofolate synthase [Campylobacterales bacterium]HHS91943.1 bifunctional folylpolyglutamate synthase/dihydrofolate synthase [Campylobacterales bacterium]
MKSSFECFIDEKPLYYKEIDHERVHKAYAILKPYIRQPLTIHVVGTNGKGSTGRIMASLLHFSGTRVGHFSSPHILRFNERIWIEGEDISDKALEVAHEKLFQILGSEVSEGLSYFEYTTLLALVAMEDLDVIVLEAGLGGEFDATNVCSKALSVITPIGLDHQEFLGESIQEIARTKMNSIEKQFVLSCQVYDEVYDVAQNVVEDKGALLYDTAKWLDKKDQKYTAIRQETAKLNWSDYLFENTLSAMYALDILALDYKIEDLKKVKLFGRFYQYSENVRLDVGHNLLAAKAIVNALKNESKQPILVYNTLADKDYESILKLFKPFIDGVQIIDIATPRAVDKERLEETLSALKIPFSDFTTLEKDKHYLVFGSFYVVESFLNNKLHKINNNLI